MADSLNLTVTGPDGTVYTVSGTLTGATVSVQPPAPPPPPPPTITAVKVSATSATAQTGAQVQCSATVQGTGAFDPSVKWSATAGSIDANGLFTAPAAAGSVTIFATSVEDPTQQGDVAISVVAPPPPPPSGAPVIPATAAVVNMLTDTPPWQMNHDAGTPGSSTGTTTWPTTAPDGSPCRRFDMTLVAHGGQIYHKSVMRDSSKFRNFCYESEELSPDWSNVQNEEKDIEQIDAKGNKLDMATQEAGSSNTEEVTGAPKGWTQTSVKGVDPSKRAPNVWHLIRKFFKNNGDGTVTYQGVEIDGVYMPINVTLNDTKASNWGPNDLNFQYQFDGKTSGSAQTTIYTRKLNVYCW